MEKTKRRISSDDVDHVASLAHIDLSDEERALFTEQLNQILEYFRIIDEVDTGPQSDRGSGESLYNVFREDEPTNSLSSGEAMSNAPQMERGYFKADKIV